MEITRRIMPLAPRSVVGAVALLIVLTIWVDVNARRFTMPRLLYWNDGQLDASVRSYSSGPGYGINLTAGEVVFLHVTVGSRVAGASYRSSLGEHGSHDSAIGSRTPNRG